MISRTISHLGIATEFATNQDGEARLPNAGGNRSLNANSVSLCTDIKAPIYRRNL